MPLFNIESKNSQIFSLFNNYITNNDMIGADVCRKFIQSGAKYNKFFLEKLIIMNNNKEYIKWINIFNWKNNNPIVPKKYILI